MICALSLIRREIAILCRNNPTVLHSRNPDWFFNQADRFLTCYGTREVAHCDLLLHLTIKILTPRPFPFKVILGLPKFPSSPLGV